MCLDTGFVKVVEPPAGGGPTGSIQCIACDRWKPDADRLPATGAPSAASAMGTILSEQRRAMRRMHNRVGVTGCMGLLSILVAHAVSLSLWVILMGLLYAMFCYLQMYAMRDDQERVCDLGVMWSAIKVYSGENDGLRPVDDRGTITPGG